MLLKKIVLTTYLIAVTFAHLVAQSVNDVNEPYENIEKNVLFGFSVGLNQAHLVPASVWDGQILSNELGLRMGVFSELKLVNHLAFAPKASLSFNNGEYRAAKQNDKEYVYYTLPNTIDLAAHFLVKTRNAKWMPYFIGGPSYQIPLNKTSRPATDFGSKPNVCLDMGLGLEKAFARFKIAPEIKYSLGLRDVNRNPRNTKIISNNLSLVLNFKG